MTIYNVAQPVVELVEAESADEALNILRKRLKAAGFELYDSETGPSAFESEEQP